MGCNGQKATIGPKLFFQPLVSGAVGVVVSHRIRMPGSNPRATNQLLSSFPFLSFPSFSFPVLFVSHFREKKAPVFCFIKVVCRQAAAAAAHSVDNFCEKPFVLFSFLAELGVPHLQWCLLLRACGVSCDFLVGVLHVFLHAEKLHFCRRLSAASFTNPKLDFATASPILTLLAQFHTVAAQF